MATGLIVPLVGQAFEGISKIISEFHASPEEKMAAQQAIMDAQMKSVAQAQDMEIKLNDIAGQNIRADAGSGDKFTARARPTFMYIIELILAFNYIVVPAAQGLMGKTIAPFNLPPDLLTLFGVCVTGYVMARSTDKALSLPGESSVNVLGIKLSNKPTS